MDFLTQAERKLGRFAIHNLTLYLVGGQGTVLLMSMAVPGFVSSILLQPYAVLSGQWWRLLTFCITPPGGNPILAVFALYLLYFMGNSLEAQWGAFRYNLYLLLGFAMTIAAAFLFPYSVATNLYITGSIFLAFARLYPDFEILLFFVLPVKVKWLALITWIGYGFAFVFGDWAGRLLVVAAVANFLLFFGAEILHSVRYGHRRMQHQAKAVAARARATHACASCGVTDKTQPNMDFRYCTKCDPPVEYCAEHLGTHEHRRGETVH
jgi:ribosomal protein L37AE/L43A